MVTGSVISPRSMIGSAEDVIEEHASVQQVKLAHQQPILGTLDECFRLYTQEEQVGVTPSASSGGGAGGGKHFTP